MGKSTGIAWCDSTWSPWIGCTKVGPGCDHCYAEALDSRYKWGGAAHWGPGVPRHLTSKHYWNKARVWDRTARDHGKPWRVFPSLCDPFDNEVPQEWRHEFFMLISETPHLTWLLLTKRIGNVERMLPHKGIVGNWAWPWRNVWLGASIVNQEEADRDIPKLLATPAAKRFVSYEPALGPVTWPGFNADAAWCPICRAIVPDSLLAHHERQHGIDVMDEFDPNRHCAAVPDMIHQIIVGGESSQGGATARMFNVEWARSTVRQCKAAGVAVFVKQLGSNPVRETVHHDYGHFKFKDRAGADPAEWPNDLRVQEFPT